MNQPCHTDYSGLNKKLDELFAITREVLPPLIAKGSDEIQTAIDKNLSGSHYVPPARIPGIGKIPIPRVSGLLAASYKVIKLTPTFYKHISKGEIASWNIFVHEGTKHTRPRRFMLIPINERKPAIRNRWRYAIMLEVRKRGLARW